MSPSNPLSIPIEALIPHGEGMRLIDTIVTVDPHQAITQATVKRDWPLVEAEGVGVIVLIELAAQTAGVCFGWNEHATPTVESAPGQAVIDNTHRENKTAGWLVGVKRACFHADRIPMGACITIHSKNILQADLYTEIQATAAIGETLIGEVHLQVVRAGENGGSVF